MSKKRTENFERMKAWVEDNGIYPEPCGARIVDFCKAFGIDDQTYHNWLKDLAFSAMIKEANKVFSQRIGIVAENALKKLITGYEDWEEFQEGAPDGKGGVIIKKMTRRKKIVAPNLGAITFFLCNRAPEKWTNPIKVDAKADITSGGAALKIIVQDEETRKAIDDLANEQSIQGKPHSV